MLHHIFNKLTDEGVHISLLQGLLDRVLGLGTQLHTLVQEILHTEFLSELQTLMYLLDDPTCLQGLADAEVVHHILGFGQ